MPTEDDVNLFFPVDYETHEHQAMFDVNGISYWCAVCKDHIPVEPLFHWRVYRLVDFLIEGRAVSWLDAVGAALLAARTDAQKEE